MKKYLIFLIISSFIILQSCSNGSANKKNTPYITIFGPTQGTTYNIIYQHPNEKDLQKEIDSILADFDISLSQWIDSSIISRVNKNDPTVVLDKYFIDVFNKAVEVSVATNGKFDMTIAPLVDFFGFGAIEKSKIDKELVDSLLQFVGYEKVKLIDNKIVKENPSIEIDFNALSQGKSVDVICEYLSNQGCTNYLVEIGGEVKAMGVNSKGVEWNVGVDKPIENNNLENRQLQTIIKISNKAIATSGNYRNYYEENGVKYAHTFDPMSGYPVQTDVLSASIITDDCMSADAYATACMVIGLDESKKLFKAHPELQGYLIYANNKGGFEVYFTDGIKNMIVDLD